MERLTIQTLGSLNIQIGTQAVTGFDSRKVPALLVYLACTGQAYPREVLAEMLWEERTQAQALSNLRVALHSLNQTVGEYVDISRETVGLNPAVDICLDAAVFESQLNAASSDPARLETALDLYHGDFLAGFYVDSSAFEQWATRERERLRLAAVDGLDRLTGCYVANGEYQAGIKAANRLLNLDPLREETHRQLMDLLWRSGQRGKAIAQYDTCRRLLKEELEVDPTPETTALYERIRTGEPPVVPQPQTADPVPAAVTLSPVTNPYKGLRAFRETDAPDFFGREALTEHLLERLVENVPYGRFLAVVGPSGCGKSSVVRAGLIPALRRDALPGSARWLIVQMLPGVHPFDELDIALARLVGDPSIRLLDELRRDRRGLLRAVRRLLPDEASDLLLVIDQFEEVFTLTGDPAEARLLLDSLYAAVTDSRTPLRVVITLRADFYDRPLMYPDFSEMVRQRTEAVVPLTTGELERAICGPTERMGIALEAGLATTIVSDVCEQPGTLPLLQYALTELFDQRTDHTLTLGAYHTIGGALGALARRADSLYANLPQAAQTAARQICLRLVTLGEGTEDIRRRALQSELLAAGGETAAPMLEDFDRARLLTFDQDPATGTPTVELAHEAIIREWTLLRTWLDESRDDVRLQRMLATAASEWEQNGQDRSYLLTGSRLAQFEGWAGQTDIALTPDENTFLDASVMEHRRQRTRRRRVRNTLLTAAAVIAVVMAVLALLALNESDKAQTARNNERAARAQAEDGLRRANAQRLGLESLSLVQTDGESDLIGLLAIQSITTDYTPQGDLAIQGALLQQYPRQVFTSEFGADLPWDLEVSPDETLIAMATGGKKLEVWDIEAGDLRFSSEGADAVFLPDGRLAILRLDGTVYVWDHQTGQETLLGAYTDTIGDHAIEYSRMVVLPGEVLVITGNNGLVLLLNVKTGDEITRFMTYPDANWRDVAVSPDGTKLLFMGTDSYARLWDIETQQEIRSYYHDDEWGNAVAFTPDGRTIATGTAAPQIRIWDIDSPDAPLLTYPAHAKFVSHLEFTADSRMLISSGGDSLIRFWDVATSEELRAPLVHPAGTRPFRLSPDGQLVYTSAEDGKARIWDFSPRLAFPEFASFAHHHSEGFSPDGTLLAKIRLRTFSLYDTTTWAEVSHYETTEEAFLNNVMFSHDGRYVAFGSRSGMIHLWDIEAGEIVQTYSGLGNTSYDIAFSPDDHLIASGDWNGNLGTWKRETGEVVFMAKPEYQVTSVNFSPDGRFLLSTGWREGRARLWDITTWEEVWNLPLVSHESDAAFSPDGRYLALGGGGIMLSLWDTETLTKVRDFTGHYKDIMTVDFSRDGKYILSGSQDGTARLWDVETGVELRRFGVSADAVGNAVFAPSGDYVLVDDGRQSRLWFTSIQDSIDYLCAHVTRDLTEQERSIYEIKTDAPTCPVSAE